MDASFPVISQALIDPRFYAPPSQSIPKKGFTVYSSNPTSEEWHISLDKRTTLKPRKKIFQNEISQQMNPTAMFDAKTLQRQVVGGHEKNDISFQLPNNGEFKKQILLRSAFRQQGEQQKGIKKLQGGFVQKIEQNEAITMKDQEEMINSFTNLKSAQIEKDFEMQQEMGAIKKQLEESKLQIDEIHAMMRRKVLADQDKQKKILALLGRKQNDLRNRQKVIQRYQQQIAHIRAEEHYRLKETRLRAQEELNKRVEFLKEENMRLAHSLQQKREQNQILMMIPQQSNTATSPPTCGVPIHFLQQIERQSLGVMNVKQQKDAGFSKKNQQSFVTTFSLKKPLRMVDQTTMFPQGDSLYRNHRQGMQHCQHRRSRPLMIPHIHHEKGLRCHNFRPL